ncbi:hypothetical protein SALBM135S_01255 [Streptomyces alboniger]
MLRTSWASCAVPSARSANTSRRTRSPRSPGSTLNTLSADPAQQPDDRVRVVSTDELMYQRVTVDQPLLLRVPAVRGGPDSARRIARDPEDPGPAALVAALRPLVGSTWTRGQEAVTALRRAVASAGVRPRGKVFEAAVRKAVGVRDRDGEPQRIGEAYEPDPELREFVHLPLQVDPSDHLPREVHPTAPDVYRTWVGCEIPPTLFTGRNSTASSNCCATLVQATRVHSVQRGEEQEDGTYLPSTCVPKISTRRTRLLSSLTWRRMG